MAHMANGRPGASYTQVQLDRILHNDTTLSKWDCLKCLVLPRMDSDHCPLLLSCDSEAASGPRPFKFCSIWIDHVDFLRDTKAFWQSIVENGNPVFVLQRKLKALRGFLSVWNKEVFGHLDTELERATKDLLTVQTELAEIGLDEALHTWELEVQEKIKFLSSNR